MCSWFCACASCWCRSSRCLVAFCVCCWRLVRWSLVLIISCASSCCCFLASSSWFLRASFVGLVVLASGGTLLDLSRSVTFGSSVIPACCIVLSAVARVVMTALASSSCGLFCVAVEGKVWVLCLGRSEFDGVGVGCRRCCGSCLLVLLFCLRNGV